MRHELDRRFLVLLQHGPLQRLRGRVLVAVSGGVDSVALLHLLLRASRHVELELTVAHLDHGLRVESGADADFVRDLAGCLGLPVHIERIDVASRLTPGAGGPEEVARHIRRRFLGQTAGAHDCRWIALGHQQDDQAETFLLRLLRGAGTSGLAAMRRVDPPYVRPLLDLTRTELVDYLRDQGFDWCEDASNRSPDFTRNRLRHQLLPQLREYNPQIVANLASLSGRFADEEEFWRQWVEGELADAIEPHRDGGLLLPVETVVRQPAAVGARLVREVLRRVRGDLLRIAARHLEAVRALCLTDRPQGELFLPQVWVGRRYRSLWFRQAPPPRIDWAPLPIDGPGRYPLPDGRELLVTMAERPGGESGNTVEFAAGHISLPLTIEVFRPGLVMQPQGMAGRRKLQDLYVDLKLTREERLRQPLVLQDDRVLWLVGRRRCAGLVATAAAGGHVVRLTVRPAGAVAVGSAETT
ncbi:MAG: tRNA lysidine(34) synthetase TilS [Desulfuromonadales bacterium]|nr:tRNA lysidine(34) synthetase TilS [Desulfuromonadales bacterium]